MKYTCALLSIMMTPSIIASSTCASLLCSSARSYAFRSKRISCVSKYHLIGVLAAIPHFVSLSGESDCPLYLFLSGGLFCGQKASIMTRCKKRLEILKFKLLYYLASIHLLAMLPVVRRSKVDHVAISVAITKGHLLPIQALNFTLDITKRVVWLDTAATHIIAEIAFHRYV